MKPTTSAKMSEPRIAQPATVASVPTTPAPTKRPKIARRMPPANRIAMTSGKIQSPKWICACGCVRAMGGGSFSPSTTRMMRSTPARMPP